ncbi:hypothetical protein K6K41_22975 [Chenggangzhangella methanolivorans]|uniref:Uncharacterized protein n=1 Tax=Chenggangzhangella methanolivorans TaxID=1437009 RepID=A0A9E6UH88_9HYPH|nr:hypothetical protein K6K41_22975 [Chenggangzhangella methanolivorans]
MKPAAARAAYRRQLKAHGEIVSLRREVPGGLKVAEGLRARVMGFDAEEIASGLNQGGRKIILLAEDVEAAVAAGNWPAPAAGAVAVLRNDRIVVRGRAWVVQTADDSTRRVAGVLIAYEVAATGL